MRFRDKVRRPKRPVVVYEILSPRGKDGTLDTYAEKISSLLSQTHIDAINIPEVHDENKRGEISGLGVAFGYVGSLIGYAVATVLVNNGFGYIEIFRAVALLFLIFSTPFLL